MRDQVAFLRQWAKAPLQIAAVAPSSRSLGTLMTKELSSGPVLELGPGTGVFTRAMIARGIPEDQIAMVELNESFAAKLAKQFPKAQVYNMSAGDLADVKVFDTPLAAALSGLGLLSMPRKLVEEIVSGVFHHLEPDGAFYQFTYGPRCPIYPSVMEKLGLKGERIGKTWRNLPPATVYKVTKG